MTQKEDFFIAITGLLNCVRWISRKPQRYYFLLPKTIRSPLHVTSRLQPINDACDREFFLVWIHKLGLF